MYQIEKEVVQLFKDSQVQVVEINMNGLSETMTLTEKDILQGGLTVEKLCITGSAFEFGTCCASDFSLTLSNSDGRFNDVLFEGAEMFVKIGIKKWNADRWENAQLHYIPLGYFTVDETPRKLTSILLRAFDRMVRFDKIYDSSLQYPATIYTILLDACKNCNVPLNHATNTLLNSDYKVTARPIGDNLTYRQMISWIAEITGTCAYIDREGKLCFKWYTPTGFSISAEDRYTSDVQETSITITGIKLTDSDKNRTVYLSGEDKYAINIDGNPLIQSDHQAIVNSLGKRMNGFTYLPYSCTTKSYPFLEPLDMITFVDKNGVEHPSIITNSFYTINQNSELKAVGESAVKKGYASSNPMTNAQLTMIGNIQNDMNGKMNDMLQATSSLNDTIANSLGLYRTSVVLPDGSTKTYLHDKPTIEKSSTIYTMTEGGFAFTKSGWNNGKPVWQYGVDKDGNTVLNTIVANALTAVHITGGLIEGTTVKGNEIIGGTITGTTINSENVIITGGRIDITSSGDYSYMTLDSSVSHIGLTPIGLSVLNKSSNIETLFLGDGIQISRHNESGNFSSRFLDDRADIRDTHITSERIAFACGAVIQKYNNEIAFGTQAINNRMYGNWYANSGEIVSSDEKLKNSFEVIDNRFIDFFDNLSPSRYKYNDGTSNRFHVGFKAQDVFSAMTKSNLSSSDFAGYVDDSLNNEKGHLGLRYDEFIGILFAKIKQLETWMLKNAERNDNTLAMLTKAVQELTEKVKKLEDLTNG